jgi:capsid protein
MNRRIKAINDGIRDLLPGWGRARAKALVEAKQLEYLAAGYDIAVARNQSRSRSSIFQTEDGQVSERDLDTIRETSNECYRNNLLYSSFMRRGADNIIGTGLTINPRTSDQNLNEELREGFTVYTARGGPWDCTRTRSLGEQQHINLVSMWREGDFLAYRNDYGWQHFQGGQMGTPRGYDSARLRIISGVQKDTLDRPDRYWIANASKYGYLDQTTAKGLRAEDCLHVGHFEWINQTRPLPIYHNAIDKFDDFFRYLEAELLGTMAAACTVLEINSPHANALAALGLGQTTQKDIDRLKNIKQAPAQVVHTLSGEKLNALKFDRPGNAFPEYVRSNLRLLGIPIGLPLEIALMDFSQTNFAAAKMAVTQAYMTFLRWRFIIEIQYLTPIYIDYLRTQNEIVIPRQTKNVYRHEVIAPKSEWLEPYKEAMAINAGIEGGWETVTHALKESMNRELVDVVREQAEELLTYERIAQEKNVDKKALMEYVTKVSATGGNQRVLAEAVAEAVVSRMVA